MPKPGILVHRSDILITLAMIVVVVKKSFKEILLMHKPAKMIGCIIILLMPLNSFGAWRSFWQLRKLLIQDVYRPLDLEKCAKAINSASSLTSWDRHFSLVFYTMKHAIAQQSANDLNNSRYRALDMQKNTEDNYCKLLEMLAAKGCNLHNARNIEWGAKSIPLHDAAENRLFWITKFFIDQKVNCAIVDEKKRTALHKVQDYSIAHLLLYHHKNLINLQDENGDTPLHVCPPKLVELLHQFGANATIKNKAFKIPTKKIDSGDGDDKCRDYGFNGLTPLMKACAEGNVEKCENICDYYAASYNISLMEKSLEIAEIQKENYKNDSSKYLKIIDVLKKARDEYEENIKAHPPFNEEITTQLE